MEYKTNVHEMLMSSRASVLRSKMSAGHLKKILVLQEVRLESEIIDVSQQYFSRQQNCEDCTCNLCKRTQQEARNTCKDSFKYIKCNRNLTLFWDEFKYQHSKDMDRSVESLLCRRRQVMAIPFILQCDLCLKWRVLPYPSNYQEESPDMWICANNPNNLEKSCNQPEHLPSIPLGTMSRRPPSKDEKEKQLQESVQRYQNRLAEAQTQKPQLISMNRIPEFQSSCLSTAPKEKSKLGRIGSVVVDLIQGTPPSSVQRLSSQRGQKRSLEDPDSDVVFVSKTRILKRTMKEKVQPQQRSCVPALSGNIKLVEPSQVSSWEMKKRQSENLMQRCKASTDVQAGSSDPAVILVKRRVKLTNKDGKQPCYRRGQQQVWSKTSAKDSLKQEGAEVPLAKTEKQELRDDSLVMKRKPSAPNWESTSLPGVQMEDLHPCSGHKVSSVHGDHQLSPLMSSQSTSIKETARKLMSKLREILLYFIPEFQLSSEFEYTSVEELITNPKLEQCPESTNEKLKTCFNKIQNIYMVQYEKRLKRKMQSIIYETNRRGILNEVFREQCELKRKRTEGKLNDLRANLALLLEKLQLDGPAGGLEQTDAYLEALLKEDNLTTLNGRALESGQAKDTEP